MSYDTLIPVFSRTLQASQKKTWKTLEKTPLQPHNFPLSLRKTLATGFFHDFRKHLSHGPKNPAGYEIQQKSWLFYKGSLFHGCKWNWVGSSSTQKKKHKNNKQPG